ncbi:hypothetical protein SOVF_200430 [Spinacia oleracea]|nr:hypothetical protein SOVF_200430 [Spinacia oleracea]
MIIKVDYLKFEMSGFEVCDRVRTGLGGRGDELVFEVVVKNHVMLL